MAEKYCILAVGAVHLVRTHLMTKYVRTCTHLEDTPIWVRDFINLITPVLTLLVCYGLLVMFYLRTSQDPT